MMNNKGLYTSALGILIILLISANIFVFLGADKSELGSNANEDILKVKKASSRAELILDRALENYFYESVSIAQGCAITTKTESVIVSDHLQPAITVLNNTYGGGISCNVSSYDSVTDIIALECSGGAVSYYRTNVEIDKQVFVSDTDSGCVIRIYDSHSDNTHEYPEQPY